MVVRTAGNAKRGWRGLALIVVLCQVGCGTGEPQGNEMSQSAGRVSDETTRFHKIVAEGDLEELRAGSERATD